MIKHFFVSIFDTGQSSFLLFQAFLQGLQFYSSGLYSFGWIFLIGCWWKKLTYVLLVEFQQYSELRQVELTDRLRFPWLAVPFVRFLIFVISGLKWWFRFWVGYFQKLSDHESDFSCFWILQESFAAFCFLSAVVMHYVRVSILSQISAYYFLE